MLYNITNRYVQWTMKQNTWDESNSDTMLIIDRLRTEQAGRPEAGET